jgi:cell division septum initiation protein DivIVA
LTEGREPNMPGIDFDRQVFVPKVEPNAQQLNRILGLLILVIAVAALGFVGYKLLSDYSGTAASADTQTMEQLQQQVADLQKRLDQVEKHRKPVVAETAAAKPAAAPVVEPPAPKRTTYKISAASMLPAQRIPAAAAAAPLPQPSAQLAAVQQVANASNEMAEANHEAWQATTERLADVVGVVGSQQSELSRTREELNMLLAQTRRSAVQFELRRGANREPVGPVSLLLRSSDPKNERYTVCVYLAEQCIELKNRALNEVVVFVVTENSAPLELVATKILRDQIVGYLEVPNDKPTP